MNATRRHIAAFLGLSLLLTLVAPASALAAEKQATLTVDVVLASKKKGPTDKRLEKFKSQFSDFAYKSFKSLGTRTATVGEKDSKTVDLADGKKLTVTFSSVSKDGKARFKLQIPGVVSTTVSLAPGGSVVLGGPAMPHGDGVLFIPVTLSRLK